MHERRPSEFQGSSAAIVGVRADEQSLDDWLGDVSDEDWSESAAERTERRSGTPAYRGLPAPADDPWPEPATERPAPARSHEAVDPRREIIERRRIAAVLALVVVVGLAVVIPVVLLRGGDDTSTAPVVEPSTTVPGPSEGSSSTTPSTTTPTSPTTPSTTTPTTTPSTPSTPSASSFTLPEGTKLRPGEGDPALVRQLQQALSAAGYDPGSVDGSFGPTTEAAVIAFQQDNGLSADGVVGPETAAALNSAASATGGTTETSPSTETTPGVSGFTLPAGTKLQAGEGDPAVVKELQQALASAGYDPGSVDGDFGPTTEAAVVAFQQDHDLSADGVVGPDTAAALNTALTSG